ncbi:MAG: S8 family serine peptidase [Lewinellaceae bacterium]|nr:S8 family serine peptidase [Lewinellaceae bacterium]
MANKVNKTTLEYGGGSINLSKSKTKVAVQYLPGSRSLKKRKISGGELGEQIDNFEVVQSDTGIDKKLDDLRLQPDVAVGTHMWAVDEDEENPLIPTGNLYIEFMADADPEAQHALLESLALSIKEVVDTAAYRVCTTPQSPNPIKCAVELQKSKIVRTAEPEFAAMPSERAFTPPGGPYSSSLWHLENSGQQIPIIDIQNAMFGSTHFKAGADAKVRAAWKQLQSLGSSYLKIAVIDTGFATEHPLLSGDGNKLRSPFNAVDRNADVSPFVRKSDGSWAVLSHGTSCASVAAGAVDAHGISGAAPNSKIIPIKLGVLTDDAIKSAFEHALLNGADVISCSLGYPKPMPLSTYVTNYIAKVAREGRSGKGTPIFIAAGNANINTNYQPRPISDFGAHPNVFCITASNSLDKFSSYSFYGSQAFLCAPTDGDAGVGITTGNI